MKYEILYKIYNAFNVLGAKLDWVKFNSGWGVGITDKEHSDKFMYRIEYQLYCECIELEVALKGDWIEKYGLKRNVRCSKLVSVDIKIAEMKTIFFELQREVVFNFFKEVFEKNHIEDALTLLRQENFIKPSSFQFEDDDKFIEVRKDLEL